MDTRAPMCLSARGERSSKWIGPWIVPDRTDRKIDARMNASFQDSERVESRLQCSVVRICKRSAGDVS